MGWRDFAGPLMIFDDRGQRRDLDLRPDLKFDLEDPARRMAARRVQELLLTGRDSFAQKWGARFGLAYGCALAVIGALLPRGITGSPGFGLLQAMCFVGALLFIQRALLQRSLRRDRESLVRMLVGHGYCGACAYPLALLGSNADGCVVCPECGAAWKGSRIRREAAPPAGESAPKRSSGFRAWLSATRWAPSARVMGDDRAKRVPVGGPALREALEFVGDPDHRTRIERAQRRVRSEGLGRRLLWAAFLLLVLTIVVLTSIRGGPAAADWILLAMTPFMALSVIAILISDHGASARAIREILLKDELCPSCMEDLRGVEPDEFGLTECPMCTAAWRVPEFVRKRAKDEAI